MSEGLTLESAAEAIARAEWEKTSGRVLTWDGMHPQSRAVLTEVAHKGICVGMVFASAPSRASEQVQS